MAIVPFEFLIPRRPVSIQAKKGLGEWKKFVNSEAAKVWNGKSPIQEINLQFTLVYLCDDSPPDIDNIIKPIQDALIDLIYEDDSLISDVDGHRRFLSEPIDIIGLPPLLQEGVRIGKECVYIKVSEAQELEKYLMINNTKNLHDEKVKSLAERYISQGYHVVIEPQKHELPFELDNYQPDIIATKDNSGLIIEVKTTVSRISSDRLQYISAEISKHPNWRFLLVTLEDIEGDSLPGISEQLPSWKEIMKLFDQAHRLIENNNIEPAFLFLWSIFEGALRKRAVDVSIPVERLPIIKLLKQMYSLGEISISQFDMIQTSLEIRNRLAHGYIEKQNSEVLSNFESLVCELLREWSNR